MANRLKEDEKNERLIRGLLKLSENRRCVNCNNLGPQYVCTNFWTFVCTNCSGIHREFTHRVKSVSMAKFTSQEVIALQEGGNQRAKEIYFKEWDSQRHSLPDANNVDRLRDFIKHVYVDRRYTGERNYDKPPRGKMGDQEGSRSPPYDETRSSSGGRSPGYEQENRQYGDNKRSPSRPQIVNDWRRDDRFGNGRRSVDRISSDGDYKSEGQSPEWRKDLDSSSPPVVRPVRDILGDNIVPLRISEPPKANSGRIGDGSTQTQRTASSSSLGSTTGNLEDVKLESTGSLIDFDAQPEPPVLAIVSQAQQSAVSYPVTEPAKAANDNNWACFDIAPVPKAPHGPSTANTFDLSLYELSAPAPVQGQNLGSQGAPDILADSPGALMVSLAAPNELSFPSAGNASVSDANHGRNMQHQLLGQHIIPTSARAFNNQTLNTLPTTRGPLNGPVLHASQVVSYPVPQTTSDVATQSPAPEVISSCRKELPEDLFTSSFAPFPPSVPGWQMRPSYRMAVPMQYNTFASAPDAVQSSKSANPFDVSGETHSGQTPTFPSMSSLQGALPNVLPPTLIPSATPYPAWLLPQPAPYGFSLPPQVPSHPSAMAPTNISLTGYQGVRDLGTEGAAFVPSNPDQQLASGIHALPARSPFSPTGGNPFG